MSLSVREEDKERIVESMNTIVQALMGNVVETIRTSVQELGDKTERRLEALREETKNSLDALRTELMAEDDSAKREALTSVETRTNFLSEQTESKLASARRDLDQRLEELEGRLQQEHLAIAERLDGAERGLTNHRATAGRITEVLNSLGHVLAQDTTPQEATPVSSQPTPVAATNPGTNHDGVETEVGLTFNPPEPPSPVETQPVPVGTANPVVVEEVEGAIERVEFHPGKPNPPHPHGGDEHK